jgi:hypothetical protein
MQRQYRNIGYAIGVGFIAFIVLPWQYPLAWIAAMMLLIWTLAGIEELDDRHLARRAALNAISRRADLQHRAWLRGDIYGTYGEYPPADLGPPATLPDAYRKPRYAVGPPHRR